MDRLYYIDKPWRPTEVRTYYITKETPKQYKVKECGNGVWSKTERTVNKNDINAGGMFYSNFEAAKASLLRQLGEEQALIRIQLHKLSSIVGTVKKLTMAISEES